MQYTCYSHCPPRTILQVLLKNGQTFWIVFCKIWTYKLLTSPDLTTRLHIANWWILSSQASTWMQTTLMDIFSEIKYFEDWQQGQKWTRAQGTKCDKKIFFQIFPICRKNAPVVFICHLTFDRFHSILACLELADTSADTTVPCNRQISLSLRRVLYC